MDWKKDVANECRRIEEDCSCRKKTYWNDRDFAGSWNKHLRQVNYLNEGVLAVLASASALSSLKPNTRATQSLSIITAVGMVCKITLDNFIKDTLEQTELRSVAAGNYDELHGQTRLFRELELKHMTDTDKHIAISKVQTLQSKRAELNLKSPPQLSSDSWSKAQTGIAKGEAKYEVDTK